MINKIYKTFLFLIVELILGFSTAAAQTTEAESSNYDVLNLSYYNLVLLFLALNIILVFALLHYWGFQEEKPAKVRKKSLLFAKLKLAVTHAAPLDREHEILLPEDYDGIKELDNQVPPWFNWLFYGSIVFAALYLLNYHVISNNKLQTNEYDDEVKIAALQREELIKSGAFINETTVSRLTDAASIESGKEIFKANCVACHGPEGGGLIGPNLTDDYWIHGGTIKDIFKTIKYGVPAKGMITWQTQLNPRQMQNVASYVMSIHGTNPANAKPPQGDKFSGTDSTNSIKTQ